MLVTVLVHTTSTGTIMHIIRGNCVDEWVYVQEAAKLVGAAVAEACKEKGIEKVVFDRAGYKYHGRVLAVADAARQGGLDF